MDLVSVKTRDGVEHLQKGQVMQSNELRRIEIIGNENDAKELESLCKEKGLTKQDLAKILFTVRVRPGIQRSDFGI